MGENIEGVGYKPFCHQVSIGFQCCFGLGDLVDVFEDFFADTIGKLVDIAQIALFACFLYPLLGENRK
jgi:hypothetical protein